MQTNPKAAFSWRLLLSAAIFGLLISCENPSSVGDNIIPQPGVRFDTLTVAGFDQDSLIIQAGNLTFIPIGSYDDPLFGEIRTVAFFRPSISFGLDTTLDDNWDIKLRLRMDSTLVYGDTLSGASDFAIYDITENWRGNELMINSNLAYSTSSPITSFSMNDEDILDVDMPASWRDRFAVHANDTTDARDSLYTEQFFGFAIEQTSAPGKIRNILGSEVDLLLINNLKSDTTTVPMRSWGYTYTRQAENIPAQRLVFHNTLESFYKLSLSELSTGITANNIIRAELVLYSDQTNLENALPANHTRNPVDGVDMFNTVDPPSPYNLQFTVPSLTGVYVEEDGTFRFNISSIVEQYVQGNITDRELYLVLNPANGTFQSTLIFDETVPGFEPKIIITTPVSSGS